MIDAFFEYIKRSDKVFWILTIATSLFGLTLVYSATKGSSEAGAFGTQVAAVLLGYIAALVISNIDYENFARWLPLISIFAVALMVYTVIWGVGPGGGADDRAWILLFGRITFQPSELLKFVFFMTFSYHLSYLVKNKQLDRFIQVILLLVHLAVPIVLVFLTGDDGSAIVFLFIALPMLICAGLKLRYFLAAILLLIPGIPLLWRYAISPFQKDRFLILGNLEADPLNVGYHQIQTKISIGSGGIFGKGLFNGPRVAKGIIPEDHNDMIFSVVGEELGLIGCILVILLLFFILFRVVTIAGSARDRMGSLMCFGFFGMIAFQAVENIGMCMGLLPVIGITLPFFSAGGSSTVCLYMGVGLIQCVYVHRNEYKLRSR